MPVSPEDDDLLDALRLALIPGIGPRMQRALLTHFETPAAILSAVYEQLRQVPGIGRKLAREILDHHDPTEAERELARCRELGVRLIRQEAPEYLASLGAICDPPCLLYCRGRIEPRDGLALAIVGSRSCTHYGRQQAERLASGLARAGVTIVSGLARGIDAAAHRGALDAGGRTVAVLATGLSTIYPPENAELAERIAGQGALLTESPLDQLPLPGLFPQRNRIISGLSLGVIVVEASRNSGALHTARHANEQGRDVFAVPGRIDTPHSQGCHDLIRDGAALVRGVDDVLDALGPLIEPVKPDEATAVHSPRELTLNDQERQVLNHVSADPTHVDEILRSAGLDPGRALSTLTVLEMKRMVRRLPGNYLIRAPH